MQQRLQSLKTNFLFFLELQLLISIVILPILIAWGLPVSIMSIVGNLIFGQLLTAFIFVSALLFTTDLLGIPNSLIALALEWITQVWHYILSFGSAHWLVGFPSWILPISAICAIAACSLYHFKVRSQNYRIAWLSILCLATPIIHKIGKNRSMCIIVTQGCQKMYLVQTRGKIYAFDCGALGARPSSQSWIEYTLAPTMIKTMGATHIDTLILCKSNSRTNEAVAALMQHIPTEHLIKIHEYSALISPEKIGLTSY
ncbi:MAG: hypothetical protein Q8Q60_05230 [Candidatus Chromulinivorax sp.]|nr:hypothetical protein [Candidatus Chromulinivorax sp.]